MKNALPHILSANGAALLQPGATPQETPKTPHQGLKARPSRRALGTGLQPSRIFGPVTQGVALGWHEAGALPLRIAANAARDAGSAAVLENIQALLA